MKHCRPKDTQGRPRACAGGGEHGQGQVHRGAAGRAGPPTRTLGRAWLIPPSPDLQSFQKMCFPVCSLPSLLRGLRSIQEGTQRLGKTHALQEGTPRDTSTSWESEWTLRRSALGVGGRAAPPRWLSRAAQAPMSASRCSITVTAWQLLTSH